MSLFLAIRETFQIVIIRDGIQFLLRFGLHLFYKFSEYPDSGFQRSCQVSHPIFISHNNARHLVQIVRMYLFTCFSLELVLGFHFSRAKMVFDLDLSIWYSNIRSVNRRFPSTNSLILLTCCSWVDVFACSVRSVSSTISRPSLFENACLHMRNRDKFITFH